MNRLELAEKVATATGLSSKDAEKAVNAAVAAIKDALKAKEDVAILGFGTFTTTERKATEGRNPQTGEKIKVPAKTVAKFKPSKKILD